MKEEKYQDRVRKNTSSEKNRKIDEQILANIEKFSRSHDVITKRVKELEKEWDIERALEFNMSIFSLIGITLAITVHPYWIILTIVVLLFFILHAVQGWCPPLPVFRYFKYRTRSEIDKEKYSLKAIRGDFNGNNTLPAEAFRSVKK